MSYSQVSETAHVSLLVFRMIYFPFQMKGYKLPDTSEGDAKMRKFKEEVMARRRREQEEKLLREQMAFEEARRLREQHGI